MYSGNGKTNSDVILDRDGTRRIIEVASNPKSIREISNECGLSLSTGYRRVYELCDCKILEVHSSTIRAGRRCLLFKSKAWTNADMILWIINNCSTVSFPSYAWLFCPPSLRDLLSLMLLSRHSSEQWVASHLFINLPQCSQNSATNNSLPTLQ